MRTLWTRCAPIAAAVAASLLVPDPVLADSQSFQPLSILLTISKIIYSNAVFIILFLVLTGSMYLGFLIVTGAFQDPARRADHIQRIVLLFAGLAFFLLVPTVVGLVARTATSLVQDQSLSGYNCFASCGTLPGTGSTQGQ